MFSTDKMLVGKHWNNFNAKYAIMKKIILIDNGHGIETKGKRSPDGVCIREYAYCRRVAREIAARISCVGFSTQLITPEDADIPLGERCARVNAICDQVGSKNALLVSVHLNAAGDGSRWMNARGWEAWTSKGRTASDTLAEYIYKAAENILPEGTPIRTDTTDGDKDKEADFAILRRTKCAAVLTENLFQDNEDDVRFLESREGFEAIVSLHVKGILNFLEHGKR